MLRKKQSYPYIDSDRPEDSRKFRFPGFWENRYRKRQVHTGHIYPPPPVYIPGTHFC
jgi:hypothetical protein